MTGSRRRSSRLRCRRQLPGTGPHGQGRGDASVQHGLSVSACRGAPPQRWRSADRRRTEQDTGADRMNDIGGQSVNETERIAPDRRVSHPLDALFKAADHHLPLLENNAVRVLDTSVKPGERTAVHAHEWPAALYVLSWSDFVRYDPDGNVLVDSRTMVTKPKLGSALWSGPIGPHYVENVGQNDLHILAVEIKAL